MEQMNGNGKNGRKVKKVEFRLNLNLKNIFLILFIGFLAFSFLMSVVQSPRGLEEKPLSTILTEVKDGKVSKIEVEEVKLKVSYKDGEEATSRKEPQDSIYKIFESAKIDPAQVEVKIKDTSLGQVWVSLLSNVLPLVLTIVFFLFLIRQARGAQDNIFSFGQSRAKLFNKDHPRITFADVAGVNEAKRELEEVVDFLKHPGKYRALGARTPKGVILVGPAGTGKCVTGDTMVWTNKGLMEIHEVPRYYYVDPQSHKVHGAGLASFNVDDTLSEERFASHWYDLGEQKTIKIQLAQGFSLDGTPEHPVVVMTSDGVLKFRKLEDILPGDQVAIQFGRNSFGNLELVDQDTAYLMGILTGDGNLSHSSRIGLTGIDEEIISFFKSYVTKRFKSSAITTNGQSYLVASWDFKRYLYQMGMSYLLSFDKIIPPTILQAPKSVQTSFLQGLFDTDAAIGKTRAEFEYTTVSKKMARQVHMMLLNLGIVAALNIKGKRENGYQRSVYRITMTGSALVAFGKTVGFRLKRKQELVEKYLLKMTRVNTNVDVIPGIAQLVEESWRALSVKKLSGEKLSKTIDKVRRRMRVSRQTLTEYVEYASSHSMEIPHLEYLRSLLEAKLFFSRVVGVEAGYERVYDFTVPQTHSFLGNGFINHNTLLARAVAGEANVPFFSIAGSEFMEMLVGVGASRARDLFLTAKKNAPAIIFIDEIDAIGRMRSVGVMGGHDEREQTLNQILVEMDGFAPNEQVVVIAATNRGDLLDPALLRPGRFDRRVILDMPDIEGRKAILGIHMKGKPFEKDVDWDKVAKRTVGFSGADLENMLNEAAIGAARADKRAISMADLEEAATKVKLGPEKKRLQSDMDRKMTAYHEAGHAIVTYDLPYMDPVHRISIVSRGMALGFTLIPPAKDRVHETRTRLVNQIASMLGGRAAEDLVFHELTTGASSDIDKATNIARQMVVEFGMSDIGPINFGPQMDVTEWGKSYYETPQISPEMMAKIDGEVKKLIDAGYKTAYAVLKRLRKRLDDVAAELVKKETLEGDEFEKLMGRTRPAYVSSPANS